MTILLLKVIKSKQKKYVLSTWLFEHFMKNVWDNMGKVRTEKFTLGKNLGLKLSQHLCDREGGDCLPSPALLQRQAESANLQIGYSQSGIKRELQ